MLPVWVDPFWRVIYYLVMDDHAHEKVDNRYGVTADTVLRKYRIALAELYGDRIERVVLFGSRARGDAKDDSDYDVALFLNHLPDRWEEIGRLAKLQIAIMDETGVDIHTIPFQAGCWSDASSPLMLEVRKDGLDL